MSGWRSRIVEAIFERMQSERLGGVPLSDLVGGGDPKAIGESLVEFIIAQGVISPGSRVFEIGCGCGRAAVPLTQYLERTTRYVGVDIVPGLVAFCRREISSRYPNFQFHAVRDSNPLYESFSKIGRSDELFLDESLSLDRSFDLIVAFSVFTHLQRLEASAMLRSIWHRLDYDGWAVLTFFVLDHFSRRDIREGRSSLFKGQAEQVNDDIVVDTYNGPNSAVGYDENLLRRLISDSGFEGIHAIHYGGWRSCPGVTYQDVVVLRKEPAVPADFDPAGYLTANPDVRAAWLDPLYHYRNWGRKEGRSWK
jgi:SAM-dependent methyltransferase